MQRQRVIITLSTGAVVVFEGRAQVDTSAKVKVVKVQFTKAHESKDESFEDIFHALMGKGKPIP